MVKRRVQSAVSGGVQAAELKNGEMGPDGAVYLRRGALASGRLGGPNRCLPPKLGGVLGDRFAVKNTGTGDTVRTVRANHPRASQPAATRSVSMAKGGREHGRRPKFIPGPRAKGCPGGLGGPDCAPLRSVVAHRGPKNQLRRTGGPPLGTLLG